MPSIFISYSHNDKSFVHKIANGLKKSGIKIWIDEVELNIGDSLIQKISEAIFKTEFLLAVLSSNSIDSNWVLKELQLAMTREIEGRRVIVLPIIIDNCNLPYFLRDKIYLDFSNPDDFDFQIERLIKAIIPSSELKKIENDYQELLIEYGHVINKFTSIKNDLDDFLKAGSIIKEKRDQFVTLWRLKVNRATGYASLILAFFSTILIFVHPILAIFAFVTSLAFILIGSEVFITYMYERAYIEDKKLLLSIEKIGRWLLPFDHIWRMQFKAGKHNILFRRTLILESIIYIILLILLLSLMISLLLLMLCYR